ncbi:MAG: hypothetical protein AVDCRST_MAG28-926, partial [uncultured Rubrobacteraceae bacterium]
DRYINVVNQRCQAHLLSGHRGRSQEAPRMVHPQARAGRGRQGFGCISRRVPAGKTL